MNFNGTGGTTRILRSARHARITGVQGRGTEEVKTNDVTYR